MTRPSIDRAARRYFVYTLADAAGDPVYVGRSCNVAQRLNAHYFNAAHPHNVKARSLAEWLFDARHVSMVGPYTWDEAVDEERRQIREKRPPGNRIGLGLVASPA